MQFTRYAIYYTPPKGPLAEFGASWLGWDIAKGIRAAHPNLPDLPLPISTLTERPGKYGLHGTIKPPFRLADGAGLEDLSQACANLAAISTPLTFEGLNLSRLGGFLALTIAGDQTPLKDLAAVFVRELDGFRAPPSASESERRLRANLNARQKALLEQWGYPYVMDEFRFHMTLTGRIPRKKVDSVRDTLLPHVAPFLVGPLTIKEVTLVGEDKDGMFHEMERFALGA